MTTPAIRHDGPPTLACPTQTDHWQRQHNNAVMQPRYGAEMAIVKMAEGLLEWARGYQEGQNGEWGPVFNDGVADKPYLDIAKGILELLNFDIGRLDGGQVWSFVDATLRYAGYPDGADTTL